MDSATGECEGGSFGPMLDLFTVSGKAIHQATHPSRIGQSIFCEFLTNTLTLVLLSSQLSFSYLKSSNKAVRTGASL